MKRPQKIDIRFKSLKNILETFFNYYIWKFIPFIFLLFCVQKRKIYFSKSFLQVDILLNRQILDFLFA